MVIDVGIVGVVQKSRSIFRDDMEISPKVALRIRRHIYS